MMNMKAMHKDFWMEIRKSKARFISIFMIVALGVAFFSGIQASSPDMRFSGDAYYDETNLMDIKVMGTLGLTEDDVAAIKQVDGVENAEGAYGTDVMCGEGEKQKVLHVEAVDQTMNRISVTEGKAPEKSGEIFLDCIFAESNGYQVGDQITLKEGGDSELLKKTDYTVVGLGESPLYISYNRGNSTLGSGEVNGFAYVLPEDFDQEVYTQIYVQAHGAQDLISYTDAYDSLIERVQERVEGIEAERCQVRYDEIVEEANDKLADARQELEDGKKEANEAEAASSCFTSCICACSSDCSEASAVIPVLSNVEQLRRSASVPASSLFFFPFIIALLLFIFSSKKAGHTSLLSIFYLLFSIICIRSVPYPMHLSIPFLFPAPCMEHCQNKLQNQQKQTYYQFPCQIQQFPHCNENPFYNFPYTSSYCHIFFLLILQMPHKIPQTVNLFPYRLLPFPCPLLSLHRQKVLPELPFPAHLASQRLLPVPLKPLLLRFYKIVLSGSPEGYLIVSSAVLLLPAVDTWQNKRLLLL